MLKRFQGLIAGIIIGAIVTGGVAFATESPTIYLNGELLQPLAEKHQGATIENNIVYLPLRNIMEATGALVNWYGGEEVVSCRGVINLTLHIGNNSMELNGEGISLPSATKLINDRALVEKSAIEVALGATISYNTANNRIDISYDENYGMDIDFSGLEASYDD